MYGVWAVLSHCSAPCLNSQQVLWPSTCHMGLMRLMNKMLRFFYSQVFMNACFFPLVAVLVVQCVLEIWGEGSTFEEMQQAVEALPKAFKSPYLDSKV